MKKSSGLAVSFSGPIRTSAWPSISAETSTISIAVGGGYLAVRVTGSLTWLFAALALGLVIFGCGSIASAFAGSANTLIFTRAVMGVGGALIMPSTLSILTNVFPAEERGRVLIARWHLRARGPRGGRAGRARRARLLVGAAGLQVTRERRRIARVAHHSGVVFEHELGGAFVHARLLDLGEPFLAHLVRAAGGVVWRRNGKGAARILLVHRPRYDDWSLPKGKLVVLGIMTTKSGKLESKDELKRRIEQAAKYASLDQLCISGQCGFASTEEGNLLSEDEQWAKLRRLVEVADEVWG